MSTAAILAATVGLAVYLSIGFLVATIISSSFDFTDPLEPHEAKPSKLTKLFGFVVVMLFWPLAIFLPLIAIMAWMKDGSH